MRGKNREREKTRERVKKGRVKRDGPNPPEGKAHPAERGVSERRRHPVTRRCADAGATGNGQGVGREREVVGGLRRIPRAVGSDGGSATAVAALIRVRRYEIIKLGLDGGEGDGVARGRKREVTEEKRA